MGEEGTKLGTAQIPIRAKLDQLDKDLSGLQGNLDKSLGGIAKKVAGGFGKALKVGLLGVTAVAVGAVAALGSTIGPASDLAETVSKVGVVFEDQSGRITKFSETSATALGMTKNEALAAAGTYGNLFRSMGITTDTSADMSLGLVQLAADLASFNNIDPEVALDKLRAGLTGETEPLKTLGVNINQALLQQKALDMGLWDGVGTLDAAAKAQASYALIMEQTALAQGDFERTSDGLANQQRINAAVFGDLKAKIGTAVLPAVTALQKGLGRLVQSDKFQAFLEKATRWLEMAAGRIEPLVSGLSRIGEAVGALFSGDLSGFAARLATGLYGVTDALGIGREAIQPWIDGFYELTNTIGQFINEQVIPFVTEHSEAFKAALIAIGVVVAGAVIIGGLASIAAAINPVTLAIAGIALVAAVLAAAWTEDWGGIRTWMTEFWTGTLQPIFAEIGAWMSVNIPLAMAALSDFWTNTLQPVFVAIGLWLGTNIPAATGALTEFWNNKLLPALQAVWLFIDTNILPVLQALGELYIAIVVLAFQTLSGLLTEVIIPALKVVWQWLQDTASALSDKLGPALKWIREKMLDPLGKSLGGISDVFAKIVGWIQKVTDKLKGLELPAWLTPGSPTPFELGLKGISAAMGQLTNARLPAFESALTQQQLVEVSGTGAGGGAGGGAQQQATYNQQRYDINMNVTGGTVGQVRRGVRDVLRERGAR